MNKQVQLVQPQCITFVGEKYAAIFSIRTFFSFQAVQATDSRGCVRWRLATLGLLDVRTLDVAPRPFSGPGRGHCARKKSCLLGYKLHHE